MNSGKQNIFGAISKGFSLIELVIVILLIGIFTAIAMTRTNTGLSIIREQIAIDQITSDIDLARSMAFGKGKTISIIFNDQDESYTLYEGSTLISDFPNSDNGTIQLDNSMLKDVNIQSVSLGGTNSNELKFLPLGDVEYGGSILLNTKTISIEQVSGKWSVN
tara:strand:- start:289 stop:777 length:489 start_codon:yes stop_codon:yes gene_type:complete